MSYPSMRRLWTMYRKHWVGSATKRELIIARTSFYAGARGVLRLLDHMTEHGETELMVARVRREARLVRALRHSEKKRRH